MRNRTKLVLTALAATLIMATAISTAAAQRLSVTNRNFRINWAPLTFFGAGGISNPTIRCGVTLEGSFHANTITKSVNSLVGYVSRAAVTQPAQCTGGSATILTASLPWHVQYRGFTGTLPNITRVRLFLRRTAFQLGVNILGSNIVCLYQEGSENGNVAAGEVIREAGGNVNELAADNTIRLRGITGGLCPPEGGFEGTGQVFLLGSNTTRIRLTLI